MNSPLSQFGLTDKEEQIYFAALELGENPASVISGRTGLNRSTTYVNLENLVQKGFIQRGSKYGTKTYWATDPQDLLTKFERENHQLNHKITQFKDYIPELTARQNESFVKPKVKYFQGEEAMKHMYGSLIKSPEWSSFVDTQSMLGTGPNIEKYFWDLGYMKRDARRETRDILTDCKEARELKRQCENEYYKIKLYPERTHADNIFFPDRFFLVSYKEGMQLLEVQNKEMANAHLIFFEGLWDSLPD